MKDRNPWFSGSMIGVVLLAGAVLLSLVQVVRNERIYSYPGKKVIRILHWQLEAGFRDAIGKAISEFEAIHPDVKIEQMAVTETVYDTLLNTNLISGNAPDLAELGKGKFGTNDEYTIRYFLPLAQVIAQPNPFNKGTPFEKTPWKETFIDGMRGGYRQQLLDYYSIPVTLFNTRYFYNKPMYEAATGKTEPPKTFGELLEAGRMVREWGAARGETITPVVNCYKPATWTLDFLQIPFTSSLEADADLDLDGTVSAVETYAAFASGGWTLRTPQVRAFYDTCSQLTTLFEPGFMGMDRQTATQRFATGKAMILTTGSWDAASITKSIDGKFEVGVFRAPVPAADEPNGQYVRGIATEAAATGGAAFGVYKNSRHQDIAILFLQYLTSRARNADIMEMASWPPIVAGSIPSPAMRPFIPNPIGYSGKLNFEMTGNVTTVYNAQLDKFLPGESTFDAFADAYESTLRNPRSGGDDVWAREYDAQLKGARNQERLLAVQSLRILMDPSATDAQSKFDQSLIQQVRGNNAQFLRWLFEKVREAPIPEI